MSLLETLYDAAGAAGLLVAVRVGSLELFVDFKAPDEDILSGIAISRDYSMRYPASRLPALNRGDNVEINGQLFRVRELCALGDGSEIRASLTCI